MVILKNVTKENNCICWDYFPENQKEKGRIEYDYENDKVTLKETVAVFDDYIETYFNYALKKLKRIVKSEDFKKGILKEEYKAVWY